ncbi:glutaredoxin family protein [Bacillus sp. 2205SS5-2]|uniref:glutaredoxin family protein n=1 Tax=Bacillus sp. 2205SS5-2 TaxID=3109031 RepID=UPI00300692C2
MNQIILYTQPDCPPCEIVKLFLQDRNITYIEKNIKKDANAKKELIEKYQSYSTPTVIVNQTTITGFNLDALNTALELEE